MGDDLQHRLLGLVSGEREALDVIARSHTARHREVQRVRALLLAADGIANTVIALRVEVTAKTVRGWRERFTVEGLSRFAQEKINEVVHLMLHSKPKGHTLVVSEDG